jgi:hypothetical protein
VTVLQELLQWGANPHATSHFGEGALHLALAFSGSYSVYGSHDTDSLEPRLVVLLQAGCDPGLRDVNGHTPSDYAMARAKTWFQWCLAVEAVGLSMGSILGKEDCSAASARPAVRMEVQTCGRGDDHDSGSDWESCGSDDERSEDSARPSGGSCSGSKHIFLDWSGFFPWSAPTVCGDCGLSCNIDDISHRKWNAWQTFGSLKSMLA